MATLQGRKAARSLLTALATARGPCFYPFGFGVRLGVGFGVGFGVGVRLGVGVGLGVGDLWGERCCLSFSLAHMVGSQTGLATIAPANSNALKNLRGRELFIRKSGLACKHRNFRLLTQYKFTDFHCSPMILIQLDRAICLFLNRAAQHWQWLDQGAVLISNSDLVKGGVVLAIFWAMWFREPVRRDWLLVSLGGSLVALFIARILASVLPNRVRPLLDPSMHFIPPLGLPDQSNWTNWSSFPSDHSALFFAIVAGIWLANRRTGAIALVYVLVAICLPRIYVGIHYPSDVVAGAALGVGTVSGLMLRHGFWTRPSLRLLERFPGWGYGLLFLLTFQIATLFWDLRLVLSYLGFST